MPNLIKKSWTVSSAWVCLFWKPSHFSLTRTTPIMDCLEEAHTYCTVQIGLVPFSNTFMTPTEELGWKFESFFCFCFLLNLGNVKIYFSSHHLFEFSNISLRYLSKWIILKNGKKISLPTQVQGCEFANWNVEIPLTCFKAIFIIFQKNWYVCLLFVSFHFSFFVSFEDEVTTIRKYYVIFVYIL